VGALGDFFRNLLRSAPAVDVANRMAELPLHHELFDLKLAWKVRYVGSETVIEGGVQNLRWAHLEAAEIWVAAFDAQGDRLAREACYLVPHQLRQGEMAPFEVRLPLVLAPGTRLEFSYRYRGSDGGDGGTTWNQSFESVVPPVP